MKIALLLEHLGLSRPSANIYLSLLKHGGGTVAEIAQKSGLYRPTIYTHLPLLVAKGLVSKSSRGKRVIYSAESPLLLEGALEDVRGNLTEALPELLNDFESRQHQPVIRFFEGKRGIAKVYEEMVRSATRGDVIYRYESPRDYKRNAKYYPTLYWQKATGQTSLIEKYVITNERTHQTRSQSLSRYSKKVPSSYDQFEYNITQLVCRDKVAFIDYESETASIIENPRFAKFQEKIFKLLFSRLH